MLGGIVQGKLVCMVEEEDGFIVVIQIPPFVMIPLKVCFELGMEWVRGIDGTFYGICSLDFYLPYLYGK